MLVKTSELIPTHGRRLRRRRFAELKANIAANGVKKSLKYVVDDNEKLLVNGHHRLAIARQLGIAQVPAEEVTLPYKGYKTIDDLIDTEMR